MFTLVTMWRMDLEDRLDKDRLGSYGIVKDKDDEGLM